MWRRLVNRQREVWPEITLVVTFQGDTDGKGLEPSAAGNVCIFWALFSWVCAHTETLQLYPCGLRASLDGSCPSGRRKRRSLKEETSQGLLLSSAGRESGG